MPHRAGRVCAHPGCSEVVFHGSRCGAHVEVFHQQDYRRWYQTPEWKRIRIEQLQREPWCRDCAARGLMVKATDVDHIEPHRGDRELFFKGPFASRCHSCHSKKTQGEVR